MWWFMLFIFFGIRLLAEGIATVNDAKRDSGVVTPPGVQKDAPAPPTRPVWPPMLPPRYIAPRGQ